MPLIDILGSWQAKCLCPNAHWLFKEFPNPSLEPRLRKTFLEESCGLLATVLIFGLPVVGGLEEECKQQPFGQSWQVLIRPIKFWHMGS